MIESWEVAQAVVGSLIAVALGLLWFKRLQTAQRAEIKRPRQIFAEVLPLLDRVRFSSEQVAGVYALEGTYRGKEFHFKAIVDNLAPRKLPSLWLMVTLPALQPVSQVLDMMMRPSGPTSFSNFDFLPHTLHVPSYFPPHAVMRSDQSAMPPSWAPISKLLPLFDENLGKELLISPKGLRLVMLLAEANRARYGVFRQADFGNAKVTESLAHMLLDAIIVLEGELAQEHSGSKNEENAR